MPSKSKLAALWLCTLPFLACVAGTDNSQRSMTTIAPLTVGSDAAPVPAAPQHPARLDFVGQLHCSGTEPFWQLEIDSQGRAQWQVMNDGAVAYQLSSASRSVNHVDVWGLTLDSDLQQGSVAVALRKTGDCSDGMSDYDYEFAIIALATPLGTVSGCCNRIATEVGPSQ